MRRIFNSLLCHHPPPLPVKKGIQNIVKGTVDVISSDSPFIDWFARFTMVPF